MAAFLGSPDSGKTLGMTWNALIVTVLRPQLGIYANYHLNALKYTYLSSIEQIDEMYNAYFFGDELWSWADSRESRKARNKAIAKILGACGKRNVQVYYSAQKLNQIDRRIRENTRWYVVPELSKHMHIPGYQSPRGEDTIPGTCTLYWYNMIGGSPHDLYAGSKPDFMQTFNALLVMGTYDTREEIAMVETEQ
jgi:hypothetical protein